MRKILLTMAGAACLAAPAGAHDLGERPHDEPARGAATALLATRTAGLPGTRASTLPPESIAARRRFFGADNVDAATGAVRRDRLLLNWYGVTSFVAAVDGHVVLLDAWVVSGWENVDTTPDEVAAVAPEAIFVGHGHVDHAGHLGEIAKKTGAVVVGTPEHCQIARDQAGDPGIPCSSPVAEAAPFGATGTTGVLPGVEITAVKHMHSKQENPTGERTPCPPLPEQGANGPSLDPTDHEWLAHVPDPDGGNMVYQFRYRGYAFTYANTAGPIDREAPEALEALKRLPKSDVFVGAVASNGMFTNGMLSMGKYLRALRPSVFVPDHHDNFLPYAGGDDTGFYRCVKEEIATMDAAERPVLHWLSPGADYLDVDAATFPAPPVGTAQQTPPPSAQQNLARGPGCTSRRSVALRLPRTTRRKGTSVTVNKRRLRLRFLNGRLHTKVDLRRPGTTFRVRIVLRTRGGRRAVRVKTFRTCARA